MSMYLLSKQDLDPEIQALLNQWGGSEILDFVASEAFEGRFHKYESVAIRFKDKIPALKKLLQHHLLFDSTSTGLRQIHLTFIGFLCSKEFDVHKGILQGMFLKIGTKYAITDGEGQDTSEGLCKFLEDKVDPKTHKIIVRLLRLFASAPINVLNIPQEIDGILTIKATIDIIEYDGSCPKYISACIEVFNKKLQASIHAVLPDTLGTKNESDNKIIDNIRLMDTDNNIPRVFISYSHDTPEHKRWVGEFASKLVNNGVDVLLDQWDLSLGDDIVKFMEKSLTTAHRVLMVCTEPYVRKADDGKGGVGYEAMIVTGELVRNLGTSKFIPIIRQVTEEVALPKSLSTRFYVNLKDGATYEEEFDKLLRELHKAPALLKPNLGKNPFKNDTSEGVENSLGKIPFAIQPSGVEIPIEEGLVDPIPDISKINDDVEAIYETALNIARKENGPGHSKGTGQ